MSPDFRLRGHAEQLDFIRVLSIEDEFPEDIVL
jgi:hypothetical protein